MRRCHRAGLPPDKPRPAFRGVPSSTCLACHLWGGRDARPWAWPALPQVVALQIRWQLLPGTRIQLTVPEPAAGLSTFCSSCPLVSHKRGSRRRLCRLRKIGAVAQEAWQELRVPLHSGDRGSEMPPRLNVSQPDTGSEPETVSRNSCCCCCCFLV